MTQGVNQGRLLSLPRSPEASCTSSRDMASSSSSHHTSHSSCILLHLLGQYFGSGFQTKCKYRDVYLLLYSTYSHIISQATLYQDLLFSVASRLRVSHFIACRIMRLECLHQRSIKHRAQRATVQSTAGVTLPDTFLIAGWHCKAAWDKNDTEQPVWPDYPQNTARLRLTDKLDQMISLKPSFQNN